ncbi:MAG: reverse transcriptase/maturase family protein [Candidatus Pacebacteria bacterium]|nr:reverse transcriptase/maturase family protein [Candidatus Paceibacterota bacterium]
MQQQLPLFSKKHKQLEEKEEILLADFFKAYFDCRKNKRNKPDAIKFEMNFEKEVIKLWREVNEGSYEISPLNVFISNKPVKREIFAAQFRDRVIHHLVINKIGKIFEKKFIYDSYSCRKGKGTHFGTKRTKKMIRQCSDNYQKDCWILKLDISGYFMSINRNILLERLIKLINENYQKKDKEKVIYLCKKIIKTDSTVNCIRKSPKLKWAGLPKSKSLFYASKDCGLPIGNYTNQMFANFYLDPLDHYMKNNFKVRYYGRYVDDFLIIDRDKEKLKKMIPIIESFLSEKLEVELHPKKRYLQHASKGTEFLGSLIKPWRCYISSRVKGNFWEVILIINRRLEKKKLLNKKEQKEIIAQINSYLGVCSHSDTYNLRKKFLSKLNWRFWGYFNTKYNLTRVVSVEEKPKQKKNRKSKQKRDEIKRKKAKKPKSIRKINAEIDARYNNHYSNKTS